MSIVRYGIAVAAVLLALLSALVLIVALLPGSEFSNSSMLLAAFNAGVLSMMAADAWQWARRRAAGL